jgi:glucan phosphoethanolaminetransferase (alkaline phosphatase superfamily)
LSEENALTALMYVPDHGEDIFDDSRNRFLHASPTPTYWQLHVPMIIWMSSAYREAYPNEWAQVNARKSSQVSSSRSFAPTVLDIAGIRTARVEQGAVVSSSRYTEPKRYYISDRNECLPLTESGMKELDFGFMDKKGIKY